MLRLISFLSFLLCISCSEPDFVWQEGDILFQDGDCGDFCDAIRKVTDGFEGRDFSHNGLLIKESGEWFVIEAIGKGVSQTPLEDFLDRHLDENGSPKVMVGRLDDPYQSLIPAAIQEAKTKLGKPYDYAFSFENDAYYCSELIHVAFKKANHGANLFQPAPMTYKDPDTGDLFSIWESYFLDLGIDVPEGELGLNPGGMSLDPILTMIKID
ncbi:YiiX/YebB-like N1pC/P60 family cysteine hydrolase [Mongoliibacter ruber]|uniref:Permuted papain-like amidase YaeF/Yiix C92 family enzyme n=1 Tax=Mongoliibacter ruber TaxID=1750599 RepID=A0A2T0WIJ1_9BACT|nr:YiiX/YebB-like N1pC/P60 family cysteine hydrolase [Mongoliibacter ruber]PRY86531.1 permuted papain-like amidase YaeF/Yiix C92 family enzyme [Mongoliibacter ruber]